MKRFFYIGILTTLVLITGCTKSPDDWFVNFHGLSDSCLISGGSDALLSLDSLERQAQHTSMFKRALLRTFDNQDIHRQPVQPRNPDHVTLYSAHKPDISLFLQRKGWSYCLDIALSSSFFSPLRKVRY